MMRGVDLLLLLLIAFVAGSFLKEIFGKKD